MTPETTPPKEANVITNAYKDYHWEKLKVLKKKIQRSRDTIFLVAVLMMLVALIQLATGKGDDKRAFFISLLMSLVYVGIGFLARKEPFGALIMALMIYVGMWVITIALFGAEFTLRGIIAKLLIIGTLASGIPHAFEADKIKKELKEFEK